MATAADRRVEEGTRRGWLGHGRELLRAGREPLASLAGVGLVLLAAAVFAPHFYSVQNLSNVVRQMGFLCVVALGQTFVLLVAGIDLSVGGLQGLAMVALAQITHGRDAALLPAIGFAFLAGAAVGLVNAALVVGRRVPPFVATFATFVLVEGLLLLWTGGAPSGSIPTGIQVLGAGSVGPIPVPSLIAAGLVLIAAFVLRRTGYGLFVYATGANRLAAAMSGLPTKRVIASTYVISALLAVLAGLMISGYAGYVDTYLTQSLNLDSIAAAIVGGTSLLGGRGGVFRTLAGVLLISVVVNFMVILNAGQAGQLLIEGLVIILAVLLQMRGRVER
ncbi:MAG TPA: ABC transporter permease [Candidatus Dormibacteraeota bacterium]|nr:ABC transporter permease [Candidatus Dormibacteraeota bacterium]